MGPLGFEPRTASAPGWYPRPKSPSVDRDTRLTESRRRPPQPKDEGAIINTLLRAKSEGKAENTINSLDDCLRQLSRKTDLNNPEAVKAYVGNATNEKTGESLANGSKNKLCLAYEWYAKTNGIEWTKPFYKTPEGTPIIPSTENVKKIIGASSRRYATIFTILAETASEGEELHRTSRSKINSEEGKITITGTKGHSSATYKLESATADTLREYLIRNPQEHPFPRPKQMSEEWRKVRNRLADNLKQPELRLIPLRSLRNYSGAMLYYNVPDPILVMRHLRHKKLETTMHYIRGITINGEGEWVSKGATDDKEATQLIEQGFQYVCTTPQNIMLFRKRK